MDPLPLLVHVTPAASRRALAALTAELRDRGTVRVTGTNVPIPEPTDDAFLRLYDAIVREDAALAGQAIEHAAEDGTEVLWGSVV